jgi:hypothetical protein
MYDHQSQAQSTHHAPFNAWLKKALRLNRDPVILCACVTVYQEARGSSFLVTAAFDARCCRGGVLHLQTHRTD